MRIHFKRSLQFIVITFVFSWLFWGIALLAQEGTIPKPFGLLSNLAVFGPFVGYLVMAKIEKRSIRESMKLLWVKDYTKFILWFVILTPFIMSFLAYMGYILLSNEMFELGLSIQMIVPVALIILVTGGPLEEFGWRGYLLPNIDSKYNLAITALVVGIIHGIWHLPLHFLETSVQFHIPIWQYLTITIVTSFTYTIIYQMSKSIRPMILLHWLSNVSSAIFMYWVDDIGRYLLLAFMVVSNVIIYIYYKKKTVL